jgi:hypothetical protein
MRNEDRLGTSGRKTGEEKAVGRTDGLDKVLHRVDTTRLPAEYRSLFWWYYEQILMCQDRLGTNTHTRNVVTNSRRFLPFLRTTARTIGDWS